MEEYVPEVVCEGCSWEGDEIDLIFGINGPSCPNCGEAEDIFDFEPEE